MTVAMIIDHKLFDSISLIVIVGNSVQLAL